MPTGGQAVKFNEHFNFIAAAMNQSGPGHFGVAERGILALVNPERLRRILSRMLDENEFLSPHGIGSISKFHEENPYILEKGKQISFAKDKTD